MSLRHGLPIAMRLLSNAKRYAPSTSEIQVWMDCDEQWVSLHVQDAGVGISEEEMDRVFEKYYRSPQARRQAGTGLGLYLVRKLVLTLGGQIRYAPDASTVRFELQFPTHSA